MIDRARLGMRANVTHPATTVNKKTPVPFIAGMIDLVDVRR